MQSFYGDTEESTEDIPGRKKSRLKSLKSRLLRRSKRAGEEGSANLSQSASDITAEKGLGSEEDLACSQGMMGSRALSHDSIFLADQVLTDAEPARVLSQENVHSKIKALQMKLQLQKMHLGPPPLLLPFKRSEDVERHYEDDSNSHSPPEISGGDVTTQEIFSKTISQPLSGLLASIPKPAPPKSVSPPPSHPAPLPVSSNSSPSVGEPLLDFSSPAQLTTCLDTSAARHRMSVKPRNQRASTKRRLTATDSSSFLDALNNIDRTEPVREEEQQPDIRREVTLEKEKKEAVIPITSQRLPSKSPEVALITSVATSKSSDLAFSQKDQALPAKVPSANPQILRVKPHRPVDAMSSERPHSSFIPSELKNKREVADEIQVLSQDKRNTPNKAGMTEDQTSTTFSSVVVLRSSSVRQQVKGETESTRGIKRPAPESGSFRFSITAAKNRDVERPQSGSFVGAQEQTEDRHRVENKPYSSMKEKAEVRDLQPKGGSFKVGRPREDGAQHKSTVLPWDKRASVKKVELVSPSNTVTTDTGTTKEKELESSQEVVEEAVVARFSITAAKNRDVERPQSGSFVGAWEQTEDRHRVENKPYSSMKEKAEVRDLQPKGGSFTVGRAREDGAQHKSSVLPWDKRVSVKKVELASPSNTVTTDTGATKEKELESSQEVVEEAVEAQEVEEDEGKTTFGIKLRSTSQSMRIRFDASCNHNAKPPVSEEQGDKRKRQETSNASKKLSANITCTPSTSEDLKPTDPPPSGSSLPVKLDPSSNHEVRIIPKDVQATFSNPKEAEPALTAPQKPQPAPQTAPSEVSWMSLAMEKTRSIQQLFASRLSRDFTSAQPAARPQAQVQITNQTETTTGAQTQTQTVKIQQSTTLLEPSGEAVKAEPDEGRQTVEPLLMAVQQRASMMSPVQSNTPREPQALKPTSEPLSHPDTTQPAQQSPSVQTDQQTTQSPSRSNVQTETQSQFAQGSAPQSIAQSYLSFYKQQPSWSSQGLQANNPLKSTTSSSTLDPTTSSASAPSSVSASGREETEATAQEKEGPSLSRIRPVWTGSVSERAVFSERRAEWTTPSGTKGVEVKKAQTEVQTSGESKTAAPTTDTKPEGGQGVQPAESSPTKVPERPREDKGPRKIVQPSSSPSSSPPMPSALQSMSDSGQPSWMELAKRKSMAWSDRSMD